MSQGPTCQHWAQSLRFRLLAATLVAMVLALVLAGLLLGGMFREHVQRQFSQTLTAHLDQITARLEFDAAGRPRIDPLTLSDPRWLQPYSGLYWQVDAGSAVAPQVALRSRSLWDATLTPPADVLAHGVVHVHELAGPDNARLLLVERTVTRDDAQATPWRVIVAADLRDTAAAVDRFTGVLAASLAVLLVLLGAAALAQVAVGLAPLHALQRSLAEVRAGAAQRLLGRFPSEVQPLIDDFNSVLERNSEVVARARTQAGNLAHAIKTPLAAMSQAAARVTRGQDTGPHLAGLVEEQVGVARRHVDWHLARARAAAAHGVPGALVALQPVVDGLLRVLERVHAERKLALQCRPMSPGLAFAGEVQDLQEILGNLLDNACKWAHHEVSISASMVTGDANPLRVVIEDDGPGIEDGRHAAVMARGARLDESVPGSGLGLAIVNELVGLYGGSVRLLAASTGGLRVEVALPGG